MTSPILRTSLSAIFQGSASTQTSIAAESQRTLLSLNYCSTALDFWPELNRAQSIIEVSCSYFSFSLSRF